MRKRLVVKRIVLAAMFAMASNSMAAPYIADADVKLCHQDSQYTCNDKCVLACTKVIEHNPYDSLAHYKIALASMNNTYDPFMPLIDSELRICSELNDDISSYCELTYAALVGYPNFFAIENRQANLKSAYRWVDIAASRDVAKARWAKAAFLASGTGVKRDLVKAYKLLSTKAEMEKPDAEFALLYGMLLDHGWGGQQNALLADYYNRIGYKWLFSKKRLRNRVDSVYLQMIGIFAYSFGDASLMHNTVWNLTLGQIDDSVYTQDNFERLIDKADINIIAEFVSIEKIAADLGNSDAITRYQEIQESLEKLGRTDIFDLSNEYEHNRKRAIAKNQEYAKNLKINTTNNNSGAENKQPANNDQRSRRRQDHRQNINVFDNTRRKIHNLNNSILDFFR